MPVKREYSLSVETLVQGFQRIAHAVHHAMRNACLPVVIQSGSEESRTLGYEILRYRSE